MKKYLLLGFACLITTPSSGMEVCEKDLPSGDGVKHSRYSVKDITTQSSHELAEKLCTSISRKTGSFEERIALATQKIMEYERLNYDDHPPAVYELQTIVIKTLENYILTQKALIAERDKPTSKTRDKVFEK